MHLPLVGLILCITVDTLAAAVVAWGDNSFGQTDVPAGLTNAVAVAAGWGQSLALQNDGSVVAWGHSPTTADIPSSVTNVIAIAAGGADSLGPSYHHCLALRADGRVVAWGDNEVGQLDVPQGLSNVVAIAAGGQFSLALRADGTVVAWGDNTVGQTNVPASLTEVVAISAGVYGALALRADGTIVAWGDTPAVPPEVGTAIATSVSDTMGFGSGGLALKTDGTVVQWGDSIFGTATISGWSNVTAVVHTQALKTDGTVLSSTALALQLTNVVALAESYTHSLALISDGPPTVRTKVSVNGLGLYGFSCRVISQSSRVYRLEYKDSLADDHWQALPLVAGRGGFIELTDPATNSSQRFYRVRRW